MGWLKPPTVLLLQHGSSSSSRRRGLSNISSLTKCNVSPSLRGLSPPAAEKRKDKSRWGPVSHKQPHPPSNSPSYQGKERERRWSWPHSTRRALSWFLLLLFALCCLLRTATLLISLHPCANSREGVGGVSIPLGRRRQHR